MKKLFLFFQIIYISVFFTGKISKGPGTFGSLFAFFLVLFLLKYLKFGYEILLILSLFITIFSIPIINSYEKKIKKHDTKEIVIDELIGVFITIGLIQIFTSNNYIFFLGLIFFRVFDIFKPGIIGRIDKTIKGGFGVILDDIFAGISAGISINLLYIFYYYFGLNIFIKVLICFLIIALTIYLTNFFVNSRKFKKIFYNNVFLHPNSISYIRIPISILGILIFIFFNEIIGLALFTFSCITDYSDGVIARKCGLETELGKSLDPLSDKIVYFFPLFYFSFLGKFNIILVILFFIIDFIGQYSRKILKKLKKETKANYFGKIKTSLVFILIFYIMIFNGKNIFNINYFYANLLLIIIILFSILSIIFKFIDYNVFVKNLSKNIGRL